MPKRLTAEEVASYRENGFLIVKGALSDADFAPIEDAYTEIIQERAEALLAEGVISSTHSDKDFAHQLAAVTREIPQDRDDLIRGFTGGLDIMRAKLRPVFEFFFNPNLLAPVEGIIGPEITLSPIQHLRPYVPVRGERQPMQVPWHQDQGVTWEEADISEILTVWIPLVDVDTNSGCLQVLPGITKLGLLEHQREGGTMIKPHLMPDVDPVDCVMKRGDLLFMSAYTPHRGHTNHADYVRWSMDLRFQKTGTPTGRPFHPSFVLQSESEPASVQDDFAEWCSRWEHDLEASKGTHAHRV